MSRVAECIDFHRLLGLYKRRPAGHTTDRQLPRLDTGGRPDEIGLAFRQP